MHGGAIGQRTRRQLDEGLIESVVEPVVLVDRLVADDPVGEIRHVEDRSQVEALHLPLLDRIPSIEQLGVTDGLLEGAESEQGQQLAHLFGDEHHEVDDVLGLAGEPGPQFRILGGDPHRAGVEVTDPHHHAARHHQRGGGEPELLGTEQGGHHHIATRLHLAVDLHDDAVPQTVEEQGLLRLGQSDLPWSPRMLDRGERRGAGAAVVAGDQDHVGLGLGHAGRHRPDPHLGHQLDVDPGHRIRVLEVVDQLLDVLDRIDVVMGRR